MSTSSIILNQIVSGTRSLNAEISSLQPSTPVNLYEIDLREIYPQINSISQSGQPLSSGVLRIYNDYNLFNLTDNNYRYGAVLWQNNYYYPFPIMTEGFDLNSAGTLPTPTVIIANTSPDTATNSFYKYIRMQVQSLGDIVGAKFTRIRSFLKYLNGLNFSGGRNPYNNDPNIIEVELPRDIYYIERKVTENKYKIEYSLASILDVENLTLPSRTVLASKCPFQYRGEGCLYEYHKRITPAHSGIYGEVTTPGVNITLPLEAPPVATDNDELFLGTIFTGTTDQQRFTGLAYDLVGAGNYGNTNQWTFTNYTLNAGTAQQCAAALTDNSTASTAITQLGAQSIVQLVLNTGAEITRVSLNSRVSITNNYQIQFSSSNGIWSSVKDVSGYVLNWNLNGQAAGTYNISFPSHGIHTGWRLISTNTTAGTQLSELDFSGQYRIADKGLWITGIAYQRGDFVYLEKNDIKYYYVSLTGHTGTVFNSPPNRLYWGSDNCSKSPYACRLRWLKNPYFRPVFWPETRGGWNLNNFVMRYRITGSFYDLTPFGGPTGYGGDLRAATIPSWYNLDPSLWPRRADCHDPVSYYAHGLPKDYTGEYLNGFLPFGGFPGVEKTE